MHNSWRTFHNLTIVFSCFLNIKSLHFEKLLYLTPFRVTHEVTFTCQLLSFEWLSSAYVFNFAFSWQCDFVAKLSKLNIVKLSEWHTEARYFWKRIFVASQQWWKRTYFYPNNALILQYYRHVCFGQAQPQIQLTCFEW